MTKSLACVRVGNGGGGILRLYAARAAYLGAVEIEHRHRLPGLEKPGRDRRSHDAGADDGDLCWGLRHISDASFPGSAPRSRHLRQPCTRGVYDRVYRARRCRQ